MTPLMNPYATLIHTTHAEPSVKPDGHLTYWQTFTQIIVPCLLPNLKVSVSVSLCKWPKFPSHGIAPVPLDPIRRVEATCHSTAQTEGATDGSQWFLFVPASPASNQEDAAWYVQQHEAYAIDMLTNKNICCRDVFCLLSNIMEPHDT